MRLKFNTSIILEEAKTKKDILYAKKMASMLIQKFPYFIDAFSTIVKDDHLIFFTSSIAFDQYSWLEKWIVSEGLDSKENVMIKESELLSEDFLKVASIPMELVKSTTDFSISDS